MLAKAALNRNVKIFVAYISILAAKIIIYLTKKAHISLLLLKKFTILAKYFNFADVFSKKLAEILPK